MANTLNKDFIPTQSSVELVWWNYFYQISLWYRNSRVVSNNISFQNVSVNNNIWWHHKMAFKNVNQLILIIATKSIYLHLVILWLCISCIQLDVSFCIQIWLKDTYVCDLDYIPIKPQQIIYNCLEVCHLNYSNTI